MQEIKKWLIMLSLALFLITKSYPLSITVFILVWFVLYINSFINSRLRNQCILNYVRGFENIKSCHQSFSQLVQNMKRGRMMQKLWSLQQNKEWLSQELLQVNINYQFLILEYLKGIQQNIQKIHSLQVPQIFYWTNHQARSYENDTMRASVLQKFHSKTRKIMEYTLKQLQLNINTNSLPYSLLSLLKLSKTIIQFKKRCQQFKCCLERYVSDIFQQTAISSPGNENDAISAIQKVFNMADDVKNQQKKRLISLALSKIVDQLKSASASKSYIRPQQIKTYEINSISEKDNINYSQVKQSQNWDYNKKDFKSNLNALLLKGLQERRKIQIQQQERDQEKQQIMKTNVVFDGTTKEIKVVDLEESEKYISESPAD